MSTARTKSLPSLAEMASRRGEPYLVVSTDAHAGPPAQTHLRAYCPQRYIADFDAYCEAAQARSAPYVDAVYAGRSTAWASPTLRQLGADATVRCIECEGHHDPVARLHHMDEEGIAVEVVFAGGQNFEELPFMGKGWNAGRADFDGELRTVASQIWNRWLADYVSADSNRLIGVLQTAVWDVEAAVREIEWGVAHGLRAVNLPAPRRDFPAYTNPMYEPIWAVCEALGAVLTTHSAGGEDPLGITDRRGDFLQIVENQWLGNRGLAQLIFGGVFHRHPNLRFVLAEQRVDFAPDLIRHLDSCYDNAMRVDDTGGGLLPASPFIYFGHDIDADPSSPDALPLAPSSYWSSNCFLSGSFLAPYEVALRHDVGVGNLMWGSDYPHTEGTWPYTRAAIRHTFRGVPEDEARLILGETAGVLFGVDRAALDPVVARIGMSPDDVATPLSDDELPAGRGGAFRRFGTYA